MKPSIQLPVSTAKFVLLNAAHHGGCSFLLQLSNQVRRLCDGRPHEFPDRLKTPQDFLQRSRAVIFTR